MSQSRPPLCHELPYPGDSARYFNQLRQYHWPVMLDSANTDPASGRYDILAANPFITLETRGNTTTISENGEQRLSGDDPFALLDSLLPREKTLTDLPFAGGAIGFFGYDLGRRIEDLPATAADAENIPDMAVGIYDWAVIVDHQQQRCWLASFGLHPDTRAQWPGLIALFQQPDNITATATFRVRGSLHCNLSKAEYINAFQRIQHYITEGDCYQVNLAKRFEIEAEGDPWFAYQRLRQQNAAPFSAYFSTGEVTVMSSSPERLLQMHQGQVETKPIKGTRPRDLSNTDNDRALAEALQHSVKDRAENLMIVDLLRNDLGKVCQPGTIRVPRPFALESFATVHHLVSTITGTLASAQSAVSLLRACFPGGSITGAPKLRAMEIIEELEPNRRGVYCGSIGYIGFDGNMDTNITIRTLVFSDHRLRFWAGGGIVADSQEEAEYQEVHDKAAAMLRLIEGLQQA
jgi:para-aminobenzoate synthetase component 1